MAKNKTAQKASAPATNGSEKVKHGRVGKSAEATNVTVKDLKSKVESSDKKSSKKKQKALPPPSESSSDSESASEDESESSSGDSEIEKVKVNGATKVASGAAKVANGAQADDSNSDSDSDSDSASDSESEEEAVSKNATVTLPVVKEDESSDSDESSSDDDVVAGTTPNAAVVNGNKDEDSSDDASDSDESASSSDSESEEETAKVPAKKRKADAEEAPAAKKTKTDTVAGSKNLFVGNLSWNVDEDWLQREFAEFGELSGCRIVTDRESGKSRGFGYVEFINEADAAKALEAKKGSMLDGREMNLDYSTPRDNSNANGTRPERVNQRANKFGDAQSVPTETLFVGNISFSATAEMFQEAFGEFGNITRVSLPTDPESQALKGFGYVGFTSVDEAKAAMEAMNGADIAGRNIRLDFAQARQDNGSRGGFRGGRGGDRGGRGGRGGFSRGGRGDSRGGRGGRGGDRGRGGRGGGSTNRGGMGDFSGKKIAF